MRDKPTSSLSEPAAGRPDDVQIKAAVSWNELLEQKPAESENHDELQQKDSPSIIRLIQNS